MTNHGPLFIVLNVGSGRGDADAAQTIIRDVLDSAGRAHQMLPVADPGELDAIAANAATLAREHSGVVVAAGGDGTINTVAAAALDSALPFGVIPQGTFNYFGRTHGISQDTATATRALLDAEVQPVQVGLINDRLFLVNASVGLYPQLLEEREAYKRQFGRSRLVALGAAIATLLRSHRHLRIELEHDGGSRSIRTPTLFVGNNALQLEQIGIAEATAVERGRLAAITLRPVGAAALLRLLLRGAVGQLGGAAEVDSFAFSRLSVRPRLPYGQRRIKVAMDGEIDWLNAPLVFRVAPQPLLLLVPPADNTGGSGP